MRIVMRKMKMRKMARSLKRTLPKTIEKERRLKELKMTMCLPVGGRSFPKTTRGKNSTKNKRGGIFKGSIRIEKYLHI